MADPFRLAFDVWAAARPPLSRHLPQVDIDRLDEQITERSGAAMPRVLVFGAYNAGKSTLVNAFVGAEVARVADHPETARVTSYPWRGFMLDDTPGIDAPVEHEQVTRSHLETADVVLFVIASDGTLEEQRTLDEIVTLAGSRVPLRIIINNKSGFRPDSAEFLGQRDRLAAKLHRTAANLEMAEIERRAPIRLVNADSALRGRIQGKQALFASSGLLDLEDDIAQLCAATDKADMARTLCRLIARHIDLAIEGLTVGNESTTLRMAADSVAAERLRLSSELDRAAKAAASTFEALLRQAVAAGNQAAVGAAADGATQSLSQIVERELLKTQRVFDGFQAAIEAKAQASTLDPAEFQLPPMPASAEAKDGGGFGFGEVKRSLSPAFNQLDHKTMVDGLLAAKQAFPAAFKGLGPAFFKKVVPFIGPAVQAVSGLGEAYAAHRSAQREFEMERSRQLDLDQAIRGAAARLAWVLEQHCQDVVESIFGRVERILSQQLTASEDSSALIATDRAALLRCRGRIAIALDQ